jgi:hypothetical protein
MKVTVAFRYFVNTPKNRISVTGLNSSGSQEGPEPVRCQQGTASFGSIKGEELIGWLRFHKVSETLHYSVLDGVPTYHETITNVYKLYAYYPEMLTRTVIAS